MKIEWMAHSCFKVTLDNGKVIVFDPYDESVGYKSERIQADLVVVSHDHKDHSCLNNIEGDFTLINKAGNFDVDGIKVTGIETSGEKTIGNETGINRMYKVTAEGINLLHLGDIGNVPEEDIFKELGEIHILFVPVGGKYTVDGKEAVEICKMVDANIMIPMHYKTLFLELDLDTVFPFTDAAKKIFDRSHTASSCFEINAANLKKRSRIIVLDAAMDE